MAGLEYQKARGDLLSPASGGPVYERRYLPANNSSQYFEVTVYPNGRILSRGVVQTVLVVLAERTLEVEPGHPVQEYKDSSL